MRFGSPHYFWLMLCIPLLIGLFIFVYQRKIVIIRRFASLDVLKRLTPQNTQSRQVLKWCLFLLFFLCAILAFRGPVRCKNGNGGTKRD